MTGKTLEQIKKELDENAQMGMALTEFYAATRYNADGLRSHGLPEVADACDSLADVLVNAIETQARAAIELIKAQGAAEVQVSDLETLLGN